MTDLFTVLVDDGSAPFVSFASHDRDAAIECATKQINCLADTHNIDARRYMPDDAELFIANLEFSRSVELPCVGDPGRTYVSGVIVQRVILDQQPA